MAQLMPGDAQDLLERFKQARERRDVDLAVSLYRDDAEWREDPFAPALVGGLAIRERWNEIAAGQRNVEFDAERTWVSGGAVLASWHAAYTRAGDAMRVRQRGFSTFELDDAGRVARQRSWVLEREIGQDGTLAPEDGAAAG